MLPRALLCYNVLMENTKHITLRLPAGLVDYIDAIAKREHRSRTQEIALRLSKSSGGTYGRPERQQDSPTADVADQGRAPGRSRNRTSVSVLPEASSDQEHVHPLQPLRNELDARSGRKQAPTRKPATEGHAGRVGEVGKRCPHGWMNAYVCQDGCNTSR